MSGTADTRCPVERTQVDVLEDSLEEQSSSALVPSDSNDDERPSSENRKPEDLQALVTVARDQLRMARAERLNVPLDQIQRPDRAITEKILKAFADYADFEVWLEGTVQRHVAQKSKSATWGLYLADAQNQAEDIARKRLAEERADAEWQAAEEAKAQAERERLEFLATAIDPVAAIAFVERGGLRVPEILKKRFTRLGTPISPNDVIRAERKYRGCDLCDSRGLIGSSLDRTRRFCDCFAGEELQYEDPGRPAREIERAHENTKNKLAAVAQTVSVYIADAIEASEVSETSTELVFDAPKGYRLFFADRQFREVLRVAGEKSRCAVSLHRDFLNRRMEQRPHTYKISHSEGTVQ
jgi:hypothetical protein